MKTTTKSDRPRITDLLMKDRLLMKAAQESHSEADWEAVLANSSSWMIRHDKSEHSVCFMTAKQIEQAVIEDLLFVYVQKGFGAYGVYPEKQAYRYLGNTAQRQTPRIQFAIGNLIDRGYIIREMNSRADKYRGQLDLRLNPDKLKEVQEFSETYIFDLVGDDDDPDVISSITNVGGTSLLGEIVDEILTDLADES